MRKGVHADKATGWNKPAPRHVLRRNTGSVHLHLCLLPRRTSARATRGLVNVLTGRNGLTVLQRRPDAVTGAQLRTLPTAKLGAAPRTPGVNGSSKRVERASTCRIGAAQTVPRPARRHVL
jgi:hypothetical protein